MDDVTAYDALRSLLEVKSAETRYGAFRALWAMNEHDPFLHDENLGDQFHYHVLDVPGPDMVHVTQSHLPEIVLFGKDQKFQLPLMLDAGKSILVNGMNGDKITVSRFAAGAEPKQQVVSTRVDDVIRAIVALGGTYPDVVQALQQAKADGALASRFEVDALPQSGRPYDRDGDAFARRTATSRPNRTTERRITPLEVATPLPDLFGRPANERIVMRIAAFVIGHCGNDKFRMQMTNDKSAILCNPYIRNSSSCSKPSNFSALRASRIARGSSFPSGICVVVGPERVGQIEHRRCREMGPWLAERQIAPRQGNDRRHLQRLRVARPLGTGEVTLTLDNADGRLAIDAKEVHVTRRVYRSGEGEYLLNRQPCRLRDIRELLASTGITTEAYCIIEQGKVDALLQSSPRDRRVIFEEAAGISQFKAKKAAAMRRMERVEQNLLRLSDIVDEVESRLRSVRLQAGKARRYRECTERLQQLRTEVALVDWRSLTKQLGARDAQLTELRRRVDRARRSAGARRSCRPGIRTPHRGQRRTAPRDWRRRLRRRGNRLRPCRPPSKASRPPDRACNKKLPAFASSWPAMSSHAGCGRRPIPRRGAATCNGAKPNWPRPTPRARQQVERRRASSNVN